MILAFRSFFANDSFDLLALWIAKRKRTIAIDFILFTLILRIFARSSRSGRPRRVNSIFGVIALALIHFCWHARWRHVWALCSFLRHWTKFGFILFGVWKFIQQFVRCTIGLFKSSMWIATLSWVLQSLAQTFIHAWFQIGKWIEKLKKKFEVKSRLQAKLNSANVLNSAQYNPPQCNPS